MQTSGDGLRMPIFTGENANQRLSRQRFRDAEVGGSNPLSPTIFGIKPFGERVEGLSPFWDESYDDETEVQTPRVQSRSSFSFPANGSGQPHRADACSTVGAVGVSAWPADDREQPAARCSPPGCCASSLSLTNEPVTNLLVLSSCRFRFAACQRGRAVGHPAEQ